MTIISFAKRSHLISSHLFFESINKEIPVRLDIYDIVMSILFNCVVSIGGNDPIGGKDPNLPLMFPKKMGEGSNHIGTPPLPPPAFFQGFDPRGKNRSPPVPTPDA